MKILTLVATAAIVIIPSVGTAFAQQKTIYVAGYPGDFEQNMRKEIIPAFEAKFNIKVEYVSGISTDTLARLQAQKGNEQIDAIVVDDGPMFQAIELGFCADLTSAAVYDDVYPVMRFVSNKAIGIGLVGTGIMYSKKYFDDHQWPAPTSWSDLKDPKYKGKLVVPPINNTYGLHALIAEARATGGGEKNIEPGFQTFKDEIGPNVLTYEPSPGNMTALFQSGQAVIAVWGSGRARSFSETGYPVNFIYPKEGGLALGSAACPVAGAKNPAEAQTFIQFLISPEIQKIIAKGGLAPTNKTVVLSPEERNGLPYGEDMTLLHSVDWDTINANRAAWNTRWTREIER